MNDGNSKNNDSDDEIVDEEIIHGSLDPQTESVIRDALRNFVKEKYNKRVADDDIEAMVATCSEFMKCFVIMGYDFKGNSIKPIFYAKNDKDSDALSQYIQKFIIQSMH
tara:strand:- start:42 stop:368 length:327 start_codon:yes stop_codon:yes gene_type:complete